MKFKELKPFLLEETNLKIVSPEDRYKVVDRDFFFRPINRYDEYEVLLIDSESLYGGMDVILTEKRIDNGNY